MLRFPALLLSVVLASLLPACLPAPDQRSDQHRKMFGMLEKFDRFDDNGDGYLTRGELDAGIKAKGMVHLTPEELDKVMKAYDTSGDRRISLHEAEIGAKRGPQIFQELQL